MNVTPKANGAIRIEYPHPFEAHIRGVVNDEIGDVIPHSHAAADAKWKDRSIDDHSREVRDRHWGIRVVHDEVS